MHKQYLVKPILCSFSILLLLFLAPFRALAQLDSPVDLCAEQLTDFKLTSELEALIERAETKGFQFSDIPEVRAKLAVATLPEKVKIIFLANKKLESLSKSFNPAEKSMPPYRSLQFILTVLIDVPSYFDIELGQPGSVKNVLQAYNQYLSALKKFAPTLSTSAYSAEDILSIAMSFRKILKKSPVDNLKLVLLGSVPNGFMKKSSDIDVLTDDTVWRNLRFKDFEKQLKKNCQSIVGNNCDISWSLEMEKQAIMLPILSPLMIEISKEGITLLVYNLDLTILENEEYGMSMRLPVFTKEPLRLPLL